MTTTYADLLDVRDLSVDFGQGEGVTHAVKHVSFHIAKGETVALVGESGSGKSVSALSILKLLAYPPASHPSGQILFKGEDLLKADERRLRQVRGAQIALIPQEPMNSLNPLHTISKQVGEILRLHQSMSASQARLRMNLPLQVAAVCYRWREDEPEFLLVQTLGSRPKWTFPKGAPSRSMPDWEAAAREARDYLTRAMK